MLQTIGFDNEKYLADFKTPQPQTNLFLLQPFRALNFTKS